MNDMPPTPPEEPKPKRGRKPPPPPNPANEFLESLKRLSKDLKDAAVTLSTREARFLVDAYYQQQRDRIRAAHQNRTLNANAEPHDVLMWLQAQREMLENEIAKALDSYSNSLLIGRWARSQVGIGPIISAGLAANISINRCETAGGIWRFAGLDPTSLWIGSEKAKEIVAFAIKDLKLGVRAPIPEEAVARIAAIINVSPERLAERLVDEDGNPSRSRTNVVAAVAKRPWNGSLKRLCYLIGESFVKVSGNDNAVYGKVYTARKQRETMKNERGDYADQAKRALSEKNYGADTDARKHYEAGRLPPARIHLRSHRYATKLFLSHYHHVAYVIEHGRPPPKPYIMEREPDVHLHFLAPPNWPMVE
jgi:hypothetical protein